MKKQIDVLVIGGGVAGAVAAAQAAAAGLKVVQVRKSMGASAYSSGAVDVADSKLDEIPGPGADPFSRGEGWLKAAQDLTSKKLRHPFARARDGLARLENGLALFADLAKDVNLVAREDGHNHVLVTQMGTLKRSALVQRSQLSDLSELTSGECVGIVEISGLLGFDAEPVAKMLKWMMKLANRPGFEVVPVRVDFMRPDGKHWRSPWEAACEFDARETQEAFTVALKQVLKGLSAAPRRLLFAPMLGTKDPMSCIELIRERVGVNASELLAMGHSVPGMRLGHGLSAALFSRGITCYEALPDAVVCEQDRVRSIAIKHEGETVELEPEAVVLASGRALGGGLKNQGVCVETIFGLPVWTHRGPVADRFSNDLTHNTPEQSHELFHAGVAYDDAFRPFNAFGEVFASNLFAAGSILEGYDPAKDSTSLGVAVLTGYLAGNNAAAHVKGRR